MQIDLYSMKVTIARERQDRADDEDEFEEYIEQERAAKAQLSQAADDLLAADEHKLEDDIVDPPKAAKAVNLSPPDFHKPWEVDLFVRAVSACLLFITSFGYQSSSFSGATER